MDYQPRPELGANSFHPIVRYEGLHFGRHSLLEIEFWSAYTSPDGEHYVPARVTGRETKSDGTQEPVALLPGDAFITEVVIARIKDNKENTDQHMRELVDHLLR